ncbi:hypothetical protein [Escherichia coli]|uniref:hypothetical protein n=1 Tax=Escherichia coli TaxID=562 RepID=UPI002225DA78|nr:hypothetical protein [Escherichia coli]MCW3362251.1 hypothetical protein [Escherichia coli]
MNVGVRDSTYVLDGIRCTTSPDLRIEEHYTDTAYHRSRLCPDASVRLPLLSPRIRDPAKLVPYVPQGVQVYLTLRPLIGGTPEDQARACPLGRHPAPGQLIKQGTVTV